MIRPRELSSSLAAFPAKTPTLAPATHTNSYALGGRDVLLVEPATPYEDEQRAWIEWAHGLASAGRRPVAIVATHHHPDHVGGIDVLARELGLPVWAHAETASRVGMEVARLLVDGDVIDLDGPIPERWTVLHTPGHARGHVCLHEATRGTLVVGDMVASQGTILVETRDGHMATYIAQLRRLAGLGARLALPAHGEPIDDPTALFERYVAHRLGREAKVLDAVRSAAGPAATDELVPVAYPDTPPLLYPIARLALEAHLVKLEEDGLVVNEEGRWRPRIG